MKRLTEIIKKCLGAALITAVTVFLLSVTSMAAENDTVNLVTVGNQVYGVMTNGTWATGWKSVNGAVYYFNNDGSMVKNATVDGFKIGKDGKVVFTKEQLAIAAGAPASTNANVATAGIGVINASNATLVTSAGQQFTYKDLANNVSAILSKIITPGMTDEQKLLACYNYVIDTVSYKRTYETPSGDFTGQYAMDIFTTYQGNCFRYASAFAYLAKGCGFDVNVTTGVIKAARGGVTPHGWAVVNLDGVPYIYDPDMGDAKANLRNQMYKRTYANYPVKPLTAQAVYAVHF